MSNELICDNKHIAYITTHSWGYAIGGEHFTAIASCARKKIDITYKLRKNAVLSLNRKDESLLFGSKYRVGEECKRFFTEKEAIKQGIRTCKKQWKHIKIIVDGDTGVAQPQFIVWCENKKIKISVNLLYKAMEILYKNSHDAWKTHEKMMQTICDKWEAILEKYLIGEGI